MKGRLVAFVGVFCVASLMVSGVYAKGKPDKPGGPETEWIAFESIEGHLVGDEVVEGCCPNNGPFPAYTMTLSKDFGVWQGEHLGQLFMNVKGTKRNQEYKVQFWTRDFFVEIVGGEIDNDKKNKVLTVTFTHEKCRIIDVSGESEVHVTFELTRTSL